MAALSKKYKINYKRRYTIPKNKKHRAHKSIKVYHTRVKRPSRKQKHYMGGDIEVPVVYDIFPSGQSYQPNVTCLEKECDKKDPGERTTTCLNTRIVMNLFSQTLDDSENATMDRIDSNFTPAERKHVQDLTKKYLTNYVDSLFPKSFFSKNNADLTPENATKLKELLKVINPEYVLYLTQTSTLSDEIKQKIRGSKQELNVVVTTRVENPIVDNPIIDNPIIDNPIIDNPIIDNPIVDNPIIDNPIIDNPIIDNPIVDNPIVDNPIVDNPIIDNPIVNNPIVNNPIVDNAIASNTAVVDAEAEADMQRQQAEADMQRQQAAEKAGKKAAKKAESAAKKLETDKQNAAKKLETDKQNAVKKAARDAADVKRKEELAEKKAARAADALIKEENRAAAKTLKNTTALKKSSGNATRKKR